MSSWLFAAASFIRRLEAQPRLLLQLPRAEVRSQDDDRVAEIHGVAQPVGQLPVLENLQQDVVHIRMRLLDFVEQDHRIRRAAHALRQLAAFFVSHISWRRADQLRYRMLFHVFGHIEANQRFFAAEQELGKPPRHFRLAHARRPEEQEAAHRAAREPSIPRGCGEWPAPAR